MGSVADILKVNAASVFSAKIYRVGEFLSMYKLMFGKT
jgi:hypothetical protein